MKIVTCINSSKNSKYFSGKICKNSIAVGDLTESALCWACLVRIMGDPAQPTNVKKNTGFPRGWKFMNEFVDKDGNVFHKGIEQPKLKNTLPPTEIKKPKRKPKTTQKPDFKKIKDLKLKIKNEKDLKKKRRLQKKLEQYLQEF